MEASVVHAVPGRLRLKTPRPDFDRTAARIAVAAESIAASVDIRPTTASVIVRYDPAKVTEQVLEAAFGPLPPRSAPLAVPNWLGTLLKLLAVVLFEGVAIELVMALVMFAYENSGSAHWS